jgi:alpha-ketoglutarate-dependent taurine dioxygenase
MPDVPLPIAVFVLGMVIAIVHGRAQTKARANAATELYAMLHELRKPVPDNLGPAILAQMIRSATEAGERVDAETIGERVDAAATWETLEESDRQMLIRAVHAAYTVVENAYRRRQREAGEPETQEGEVSNG